MNNLELNNTVIVTSFKKSDTHAYLETPVYWKNLQISFSGK